jgi:hypothetical protein
MIHVPAKRIRRNMADEYSTESAPVLWTEHLGCTMEDKTVVNDVYVEVWR